MTLVNLTFYYTCKNIKYTYNNNNNNKNNNTFKTSALTWNYKFYLPDRSCSFSDIQDYFDQIIKKTSNFSK